MKRHAILLALLLVLVLVGNVAAAVTALSVARGVIAGGGGRVTNGNFVLTGTIGQPVTGVVSQGNYSLCSGFWCNFEFLELFLPLISK